ncbi:nuclear transport factor 2 family protein [Streptomyces sp. SKN60]|uniref:nuclear transport factor 2 family protein n=1 Tax=Streptomyces sp. SKN60 TaxID=2855506 RepID=UPI0022485B36|nr:nuclear transport factor 2 family protein [Streptomyces sp. SKN60]MCX2185776.1 nuclear transport factor 2 family protein [Streptomyces sp. SKN60]
MEDVEILNKINLQFIEAFRRGSWEILRPILSDSFSYLDGSTGEVWDRHSYAIDLEGNAIPKIEIDQVVVHVDGEVAAISARVSSGSGKYSRYLDTYFKRDGQWLCSHACVWPLA